LAEPERDALVSWSFIAAIQSPIMATFPVSAAGLPGADDYKMLMI
jgi:hypothetical protein